MITANLFDQIKCVLGKLLLLTCLVCPRTELYFVIVISLNISTKVMDSNPWPAWNCIRC